MSEDLNRKNEELNVVSPVNLTILFFVQNSLILEPFSRLLMCKPYPSYKYASKDGLIFLGKNDVIVGNKSDSWESTGVRCQGEHGSTGAMKNCVSIDYQTENKNYNVKIYMDKFHIVGINSMNVAHKVVDGIIKIVKKMEKIWKPFFEMTINQRRNFIKSVIFPLIFENGNLRDFNDRFYDDYSRAIDENIEYKSIIKQLLKKTLFYSSYE